MIYLDDDLAMNNNSVCINNKSTRPASRSRWSNSLNAPKTPSNLVKSTNLPSFSSHSTLSHPIASEVLVYDRQKLLEFLTERETNLFKTRDEYEEQFESFFSLAKRFHTEKLNNLKLTFKNQILKQQIYFETELLELSKECMRDYECSSESKGGRRMFSSKKQSAKTDKFERENQIIKLFKSDMKKLLDYMREALITSSDTLIEGYETCHILKTLETIENNFEKQNSQMKLTTSSLVRSQDNNEQAREIENDDSSYDSELTELNKQLSDEQELFNTYKDEMDDLMHILDDIELQHLQRKDQLTTKAKLFNKLKMKFKFVEGKYDKLSKKTGDLKFERYIFKKLCIEKQHISSSSACSDNDGSNLECNLYTKSSTLSSLSTCLSTTSSSRSSSTYSLSDCISDIISSTNGEGDIEIHPSPQSSSSSSLSNQEEEGISEQSEQLMINSSDNHQQQQHALLDGLNEAFNNNNNNNQDPNNTKTEESDDHDFPSLSLVDYNRKLCLINQLINLHKSKMSPKDLWAMSSETDTLPANEQTSLNNFTRANIKYFNLKEEDISICYTNQDDPNKVSVQTESDIVLYNVKQRSSLDLSDVSTDGDRVCVENCNLKLEHDVSEWQITRQIEEMPIRRYKFPQGSVINAGKCLRIQMPFANDQLEYLEAMKMLDLSKVGVSIRTRLMAPDGSLKALHTQKIPQFYQEIFRYANLIKFL